MRQAIPPRPTERGATDENFNHFCPHDFDLDAKVQAGLAALDEAWRARVRMLPGRSCGTLGEFWSYFSEK